MHGAQLNVITCVVVDNFPRLFVEANSLRSIRLAPDEVVNWHSRESYDTAGLTALVGIMPALREASKASRVASCFLTFINRG